MAKRVLLVVSLTLIALIAAPSAAHSRTTKDTARLPKWLGKAWNSFTSAFTRSNNDVKSKVDAALKVMAEPPSPQNKGDRIATLACALSWFVDMDEPRANMGQPLSVSRCPLMQLTKVDGFDHRDTDTQWFAAVGPVQGEQSLFIAYRGTNELADILTDAKFIRKEVRLRGLPKAGGDGETGVCTECGKVHSGVLDAYYSARGRVLSAIQKQLSSPQGRKVQRVYAVGHSLGGSLASVLALDLALNHVFDPVLLRLITFGCPPVGDQQFASELEQLIPSSRAFRYVTRATFKSPSIINEDPVPQLLPDVTGYRHAYLTRYLYVKTISIGTTLHDTSCYMQGLSQFPDVFGVSLCTK